MPRGIFERTPEHCARIAASQIGRVVTPETRAKISASRRGKRAGRENGRWNGGRRLKDGYVMVYAPDSPMADTQKYVYEHRLVMAEWLGRDLLSSEVVHHVNGDKTDNRIENLMFFSTHAKHRKYEMAKQRALRGG